MKEGSDHSLSPPLYCTPLPRIIHGTFKYKAHGISLIPTSSPPPLTSTSALLQNLLSCTPLHQTEEPFKCDSLLARSIPHPCFLSSSSAPLFLCSLPASAMMYRISLCQHDGPSYVHPLPFSHSPLALLIFLHHGPLSRCYVHFFSLFPYCSLLPPPIFRRGGKLSHLTLLHSSPFILITGPTSLLVLPFSWS